MKISLTCLIFLTLLSLWIVRDLFGPDFFQSHDALYHVVRLDQFHKALLSGQFPVRWAPDLLNGLGYPLFVVNYHLPYYLAEAFHLFGLSLFDAIKATFIVSAIASAMTSYWLFLSWTKKPLAALSGSLIFLISPYRLANIFERGALGEAVAYIFIPLVFLGLDHIRQKRSIKLFSLALAGLTLSHTVVAITFAPLFLGYIIYAKPNLLALIKGSLLAFCLSAFQLFPVIFERRFMKFDVNLTTAYLGHFKNLYQLLRIPHSGINIGTRFQVGIANSLIILLSMFWFKKYWLWIISALLALFLITPASKILWDTLPLLPMVLYPWRFLGVITFAAAAISVRFPKLISVSLLLIALFTTRHYTKADAFIPPIFPQEMLAGNATTQNEFHPISPDKLGSPGGETPIRRAGNWTSLFSLIIWLL